MIISVFGNHQIVPKPSYRFQVSNPRKSSCKMMTPIERDECKMK